MLLLRNLVADTLLLILILELFLGEDAPELPKVAVVALTAGLANLVVAWFLILFGPLVAVPAILVADSLIISASLWILPWRAATIAGTFVATKIVLSYAAIVLGRFFW